ncbi:MAG: DUF1538 domain-containing protein [Erysipelotrichaceae bacterium]|jgi:hypothetical protein|nr:DUF1538 domain-containing protein [Erysipelotrichaceae bacterium]
MRLLKSLKDVFISSLPLLAIIILVSIVFPFQTGEEYLRVYLGYVFVIVGQAFFLLGVDHSIIPMGKEVGGSIHKIKRLAFVLIFGFLFGLVATVVEPALLVFVDQVTNINPNVISLLFIGLVGVGTGVFVALSLLRIIKNINLKWLFFAFYAVTFLLVFLVPNKYVAIAFDASGLTTGDISVPFILALGLGSATTLSKSKTNEESFGIVGLSSIGSIMALLIYFVFIKDNVPFLNTTVVETTMPSFGQIALDKLLEVFLGITPILVLFFVFQFVYIKLPLFRIKRLLVATVVVIVGLYIFLVGCDYGFIEAGNHIGKSFTDPLQPEWLKQLLYPICFVLCFAVTLCEPAVTVLGEQVETLTNGFLKKMTIKFTLAIGIGISGIFTIVNIFWVNEWAFVVLLVPLYVIALVLMIFTPKLFVALAFDSGGVSGGAITSAFLVPLVIGCASNLYLGNPEQIALKSFGNAAFVSITPIIAIEVLSLFFHASEKYRAKLKEHQEQDYQYLKQIATQFKPPKVALELEHE